MLTGGTLDTKVRLVVCIYLYITVHIFLRFLCTVCAHRRHAGHQSPSCCLYIFVHIICTYVLRIVRTYLSVLTGGTLDTKVRLRPDKYKDGIDDPVGILYINIYMTI